MVMLPVACTLGPEALEARRASLLPGLLQHAATCEALPEGIRATFDARTDALSGIVDMIELERRCCRFLRFQVTVEPGDAGIVLDVTGPAGTGEFLAGLIAGS